MKDEILMNHAKCDVYEIKINGWFI